MCVKIFLLIEPVWNRNATSRLTAQRTLYPQSYITSGIYAVINGSDQLITWNLASGELVSSDFVETVNGISDWEAVAWTGTRFLLARPNATRLFAVSATGVRAREDDLVLVA